LIILSRLRKLEEITTKIIKEMPITYDIQQDGLYKEGIKKGLEQGIEKGIEQGIEKGIEQGLVKVVIRCLQQGKSVMEISSITGLSEEQIKKIKAQ